GCVPFCLSEAGSVRRRFSSPAHAELGEHVRDVVLHRLLREVDALTDLTVGQPLRHEVEDLALLVRERAELVFRRLGPYALEHAGGDRRVEERLAAPNSANGIDKIRTVDVLQ